MLEANNIFSFKGIGFIFSGLMPQPESIKIIVSDKHMSEIIFFINIPLCFFKCVFVL